MALRTTWERKEGNIPAISENVEAELIVLLSHLTQRDIVCFVFLKSHVARISHRAWKTKPIKAERRTCTAALRFWCLQWWRGHHRRRHHCHCHFQHPPQQPLLQAKHTRRTGSYLRSSWQAIRKSHDRNKIKKTILHFWNMLMWAPYLRGHTIACSMCSRLFCWSVGRITVWKENNNFHLNILLSVQHISSM